MTSKYASKQKIRKKAVIIFIILIAVFLFSAMVTPAHAAGLVEDTVNPDNAYSKYPLDNYQLDFFVDNSWGWLPWNWTDGIGKQVMYGLYSVTNFLWTINLYLSSAMGFVIQEAYSLDFIADAADFIGESMQTIAGVSQSGFSTDGFYPGFMLLLILIVGIYVAYTGLIKRETTKAIRAVASFLAVFILSAAFLAYAPDYINKINEFSADISNASLSVGTKIVMPNSESKGRDSVDLIRDSLFSVQIQQPWLLLQFNNTDIDSIGTDRIDSLLETSPNENNGEDREEIVKAEIEDNENTNLTVTKTVTRLGMVFFLLLCNILISIFVFLLTGTMIFSQILFIIYALFLPISFLLSMIPSFDGMAKRAITKLFNTVLMRAGITLVITAAFSISTMVYSLASGYPFFLTAFLQIVTFAGIYFKLGDLMSMLSLQSGDSQSVGRQIMRKPKMLMHTQMNRLQRKLGKSIKVLSPNDKPKTDKLRDKPELQSTLNGKKRHNRPSETAKKPHIAERAGNAVGNALDTKDKLADKAEQVKDGVKAIPTNAKYAVSQAKNNIVNAPETFVFSIQQTRADRQKERQERKEARLNTLEERRAEITQTKNDTPPPEQAPEPPSSAAPVNERPSVSAEYEKKQQKQNQPQDQHKHPEHKTDKKAGNPKPDSKSLEKTDTKENLQKTPILSGHISHERLVTGNQKPADKPQDIEPAKEQSQKPSERPQRTQPAREKPQRAQIPKEQPQRNQPPKEQPQRPQVPNDQPQHTQPPKDQPQRNRPVIDQPQPEQATQIKTKPQNIQSGSQDTRQNIDKSDKKADSTPQNNRQPRQKVGGEQQNKKERSRPNPATKESTDRGRKP